MSDTAQIPRSLAVVTYKWAQPGYRSKFTGEHVNILGRMLRRHLPIAHRFICFTDDPKGIDPALVDVRQIWSDYSDLANPSAPGRGPSCYRRLKMFSRDFGNVVQAERILAVDLDVVITADMTKLVSRPEEIVLWGDTSPPTPYNGSLILFTAGARPCLWEEFDPIESPRFAASLRYYGSDQAWIGARLGKREAMFTRNDGVYSFRNHLLRFRVSNLPPGAVMVIFHGQHDPDGVAGQRLAWVRANYR